MINKISAAVIDTKSLPVALTVLSSEYLLRFKKEIEDMALERMAEKALVLPGARERKRIITGFKVMLTLNGITPEKLLAFARGPIRTSKQNW